MKSEYDRHDDRMNEFQLRELIAEVEAYLVILALVAPIGWLVWFLLKVGLMS